MERRLDFMWVEVGGVCNLRCAHCYSDSGPGVERTRDLAIQTILARLGEAHELGLRAIQFIGGEPLSYPYLAEAIRAAVTRGLDVEVFTNATLLDEWWLDLLERERIRLACSVYSSDPLVHDRITNHHGSHESTMAAIRAAARRGIRTRIAVIEVDQNMGTTGDTVGWLRAQGFAEVRVDRRRKVGRGRDCQPDATNDDPLDGLCGRCHLSRLALTPFGVFPCVFARSHKVGEPSDSLHDVLDGSQLREFSAAMERRCDQGNNANCGPDACPPDSSGCSPDNTCGPDEGWPCGPDSKFVSASAMRDDRNDRTHAVLGIS